MPAPHHDSQKSVGLFVTCLVDLFRPQVGFATVKLLEEAGFSVTVPLAQTCCGQPAYNSGDKAHTKAIARQVIETFEPFDHVVVPSGSCAATIKIHYPRLFAGEGPENPPWHDRALALAQRTFELTDFLSAQDNQADNQAGNKAGNQTGGNEVATGKGNLTVTYHDSCSGLQELAIRDQPRQLLGRIEGLELAEMIDSDVCCGFGGTFSVNYDAISNRIVERKSAHVTHSGAEAVTGGDLGCLMNIAGKLHRQGKKVLAYHVAEILESRGRLDTLGPAIGEAEPGSSRGQGDAE